MDLTTIESAWQQWESQHREKNVELQQRIDRLESEMQRALASAESRHKKELAEILRANESSKQSLKASPNAGEVQLNPTESSAVNTSEGMIPSSEFNALRGELEAKLAECEVSVPPPSLHIHRIRSIEPYLLRLVESTGPSG